MGRPKKEQPEIQPQKVAPQVTERAQPKIVTVQAPIKGKSWYLKNKKKGSKTKMSQHSAQKTASKYPQQFTAVYE